MIKRLMSVSMLMMAGGFAAGAWAASAPIDHDVYAVQQTSVCKGVVRDINGEALIGATVTVKGSKTQGTITDDSGTFTLKNVSKGATLHISYIGYESKDVKWQGSNMEVTVDVFDMAGRKLWTKRQKETPVTNTVTVDWDLTSPGGSRIGTGIYLYRVKMATADGEYTSKTKKLVVLSNK